jgi:Fe-S-cluster containining protein
MDPTEPPPLCTTCGLCCDGTLFNDAPLEAAERHLIAELDLESVTDKPGRQTFRLPCPRFSAGTCEVYSARPAVCRKYRCVVLKAVEAGTISRIEAERRIGVAQQAAAEVRKSLPAGETIGMARTRVRESGSTGRDQASLKLSLMVLDRVLERYFRAPRTAPGTDNPDSAD